MITGLSFALNWNEILERHGVAVGALALAAVFALGIFDAVILKKKDWACAAWFLGLVSLTAWIAFSWTTASILAGAMVFACGLILLIVYYRSSKTEQEPSTTKAKT